MKYLTEREEKIIMRTVREIKGKKASRDYMILLLGFNTGLRCSEIIGLNVGDVRNKEKLYVRAETAKRSKARTVPINTKLRKAIHQFMKLKLKWGESIHDEAPLFVSKLSRRLSRRSLQDLFESWSIRSGMIINGKAEYSVHSMRHTFAKRMIQRGIKPEVVQKLLGHTSLASTGIYIEAGIEEMEEAVNAL